MSKTIFERFWVQVQVTDECWLWTGTPTTADLGYGRMWVGYEERAHRISWQFFVGRIPKNLFVLHHCDVPLCVNPAHLFLGTKADNMVDKVRKNRQAKGINHGNAKLTDAKVRAIRKMRADGASLKEVAERFDITMACVSLIALRRHWKHVGAT